MDVCQRTLQAELMDQPGLDLRAHRRALIGLRRINWWSRTAAHVWGAISEVARRRNLRCVRVLDVACGGGDLAIALRRYAQRDGISVEVRGCDVSETAVNHARASAQAARVDHLRFFAHDALREPLPDRFDFVTCTLFLHHLTEDAAVALLDRMRAAARVALVVDDLLRSRAGLALAHTACRVLTRSPIVRFDGPASVCSAFALNEVCELARAAELHSCRLKRHWPQRFMLTWERDA